MIFQYSYAEKIEIFPERPCPERKISNKLVQRLSETGSLFHKENAYDNLQATNHFNQLVVMNIIENNPQISTPQISEETEICRSSVCRILKRHSFHPYHIELHQELYGEDFQKRLAFYHWAENQIREIPYVFDKQDEAPPHYSQIARAELQMQFGDQWISRGDHRPAT